MDEGFLYIYEWRDKPGTEYPVHSHAGKVTVFILEGELVFRFPYGEITLATTDQFDVPVDTVHTTTISNEGCTFLVGEMIRGDSELS